MSIIILSSNFKNTPVDLVKAPGFSGALVPCTPITKTEVGNSNLWMPSSYRRATEFEKSLYCDGCGSIKVWINRVLAKYVDANKIYGLVVREACDVHDWQYHFGESPQEKEFADRKLLTNLLKLINACPAKPSVKFLMRQRAYSYYEFVSLCGDDAFYCNVPHRLLAN